MEWLHDVQSDNTNNVATKFILQGNFVFFRPVSSVKRGHVLLSDTYKGAKEDNIKSN